MHRLGSTFCCILMVCLCPAMQLFAQESADLVIYSDTLQSPWVNASWSAAVTFGSNEQAHNNSTTSMKVDASAWGALSLHNGSWGSAGVNPGLYESFDFAIHGGISGANVMVFFENDAGQTFPSVTVGDVAANAWSPISIAMNQLNPNSYTIHRIAIQEMSGSGRTFYVDEMRFVGTSSPAAAPVLAAPSNGTTGVVTNPTLSWTASTGAESYRLQVSTDSTFSTPVADASNLAAVTYALSGLANSTVYYWRVNATNSYGTSDWSTIWNFKTRLPAPTLASPANSASGVSTSPLLVWNSASGATSYRLNVDRIPDNGSSDRVIDANNITDTSYAANELSPNTTYYWRLNASNSEGTSDWSDGWWSFTTAPEPPSPSSGWTLQSSGTSATLSGVSFTDANTGTVVGASGTILRTTDGGETWTSQSSGTTVDLAAVSFADANTGIAVGASGTILRTTDGGQLWSQQNNPATSYNLSSVDFYDNMNGWVVGWGGNYSNGIILKTSDGGATWIQQLTLSYALFAVDFVSANVGWTVGRFGTTYKTTDGGASWVSQGNTGYWLNGVSFADEMNGWAMDPSTVVLRTTNGGTTWTTLQSGTPQPLSDIYFTNTLTGIMVGEGGTILRTSDGGTTWQQQSPGLTNNLYAVTFIGGRGFIVGAGGVILRSTDEPLPPPASQTLASPVNGATEVSTSPTLSWNASSGATSYRLQVSIDSAFTSTAVDQSSITATSYSVSGLAYSTLYYWRMSASNGSGTSDWSSVWSFMTVSPPPPPTAPVLLSPTDGSTDISTSPTLSWNASSGAASYRLQVSADSNMSSTVVDRADITGTSYNANGLSYNMTYFWRVNATGTGGTSDWSSIWSFTTTSPPPPAEGWVALASGTSAALRDVSFIDGNTGTAVGDGGTIIRTTDGGETWTAQSSGVTTNLSKVSFTDANNGIAIDGGSVLRTTDGGATWTIVVPPSQYSTSYTDVCFVEANAGTIAGNSGFNGITRRTTDGGSTWTDNQDIGGFDQTRANSVSFANANNGIAVGQGLRYYFPGTSHYMAARTTDGGATWSSRAVGPTYRYPYISPTLLAVSFIPQTNTAFAVGSEGIIAKTTDGGASWTTRYTSRLADLFAVHFTDANNGTAVGASGTIVRTTDGGNTWRVHASGTTETLLGVSFTDANTGTIVGANGIVLRTTTGGANPPAEPVLAYPANGATGVPVSPTLNWEAVPNATDYHLQVSTTPDFSLLVVNEEHTMETSHMLNMLSNEATYYWRVHARSAGGSSDWTTQSFTTETFPAQPNWISQTSGTTNTLRAVSFVDEYTGTAVGNAGTIVRTIDGGMTWAQQTSGITADLHGVAFTNAYNGVAVGNNVLLRTTDGGATWTPLSVGSVTLRAVTFSGANNGLAVGMSQGLRTTDGGDSWTSIPVGSVWGLSMKDANFGIVVGRAPLYRGTAPFFSVTNDGGASWSGQTSWTQGPAIIQFNAADAATFTMVGEGGNIWRGPDYQAAQPSVTSNTLLAVKFTAANMGTAVGAGGVIVRTTDGGTTWRKQSSGTTATLNGVSFVNDSVGWAVGEGGTILRTNVASPPPLTQLVVYNEALESPWLDASWSATVTYGSTDRGYQSSSSIKTEMTGAWGALSMHHGSWGSEGIRTDSYQSLDFVVFALESGTSFSVFFENDQGQSFPAVGRGPILEGGWVPVSIPISQLNPSGQTVHRTVLQEVSGSQKTFYVDAVLFIGAPPQASLAAAEQTVEPAEDNEVLREFRLAQNYPNPFNPSTNIRFSLAEDGRAVLKIYNVLGQEVAALFDEVAQAGRFYRVRFYASTLPSGVYFAELVSNKQRMIQKMMLMK